MIIRLAPLLLLAALPLGSCATGSLDCSAGPGLCKAGFQRFLTKTSVKLTTPDGGTFSYSSDPSEEATAQAFAAIDRLSALVARQQPAPLVPPSPDDAAWRAEPPPPKPRLCPETGTPHRVTGGAPWMIEGVAHALDI